MDALDRVYANVCQLSTCEGFQRMLVHEKKKNLKYLLQMTLTHAVVQMPSAHRCCLMLCVDRSPYRPVLQNLCRVPDQPNVPNVSTPTNVPLPDASSLQSVAAKYTEIK